MIQTLEMKMSTDNLYIIKAITIDQLLKGIVLTDGQREHQMVIMHIKEKNVGLILVV